MLEIWEEVGKKLKYDLIDNIITRVNVVLAIKGWYIRFQSNITPVENYII